jgi:hypothetical protein
VKGLPPAGSIPAAGQTKPVKLRAGSEPASRHQGCRESLRRHSAGLRSRFMRLSDGLTQTLYRARIAHAVVGRCGG